MDAHQLGQHVNDSPGADGACHVDGQALAGVRVHDGQVLDLLPICRGVEEKVTGPHRVGLEGRERPGPAGRDAAPGPALGQLQARTAPDAVRARPAQLHALALQEYANAPVAIAGVLGRQSLHGSNDALPHKTRIDKAKKRAPQRPL